MAPINKSKNFLSALPDLIEIQESVNNRYDGLFRTESSGKLLPFVCCVCDEFLLHRDDFRTITVKKMESAQSLLSWEKCPAEHRIQAIQDYYVFGDLSHKSLKNHSSWVAKLALSPRGCMFQKAKGCQVGFLSCIQCKEAIDSNEMPLFAIRNGNYCGPAPECLTELNEVELSFLQPEKTHGVCHVWNGGKQLKGNMTFMRVKERRVAAAAAALEAKGLCKNVVVLCHGKMTDWQRKRYSERTKVRTDKLIEAARWLCKNNACWKGIDFDGLVDDLRNSNVIRIDRSTHVESSNTGTEEEEIFTCYYPDGAADTNSGGFDEPGAFKKFVEDLAKSGFDLEMTANLQKQFVKENASDQLLGTCLLQFPYGICGLDEKRMRRNGSMTNSVYIPDYIRHLSLVSNPTFQTAMLQLVMHNMVCRQRLLNASRLQVRGEHKAKAIANGLNYSDLHNTIQSRRAGNRFGGTNISRQFLDSVDACTKALPHTNEAAKAARGVGESMQHHFGTGSIFLTVTFDDEHCIMTQILSGEKIDGNEKLDDLTEEELRVRSKRRKEVRLKFPGVCALNFEMLLQILCEEVIGWDWRNKRPTENPGYYGFCEALSAAIEEQGRKSLHVHMTLWIRGYSALRNEMCFGTGRNKINAENVLKKYYDHVATTQLVQAPHRDLMKLLGHECSCGIGERVPPIVVEDQQLRYLRHRTGHKDNGSEFARCIHCMKKWTGDELVARFVTNSSGMPEVTSTSASGNVIQELPKHRMHATIVNFQSIPKSPVTPKISRIINATYQTHSCNHHSSCFKCQKGSGPKRKHVCGPMCECRYRLPDRKRPRTLVKTEVGDASWYSWNGSEDIQPLVQVLPKRGKYDLYQNISCPAVSETKLACNSNVALITEGPIGQYQFKYHLKQTQDDDTAEYAQVDATIKKVTGRLHENEKSEAIRLITRGAFAHNKTNVINAPLASYLLRNSSRFYFSHEFQYCPVKDLMKIHRNKGVSGLMRFCGEGGNYFENQALNYLCRPSMAEFCSPKKFFETYEVRFATKKSKEDGVVPFIADTGFFVHPSRFESPHDGVVCRQGIMERVEPVLAKVTQWAFPDTATFHGNILECDESKLNGAMEGYAELVLTLLLPHRHGRELKMNDDQRFPYARKLREVWETEQLDLEYGREIYVFTEENQQFLQNVQNSRSNSLRYKVKNDDLAGVTVPYDPDEDNLLRQLDEDLDPDEYEQALEDAIPYETFMDQLQFETEVDPHDNMPELLPRTMNGFKFDSIRNEGTQGCGYMDEASTMAPEVNSNRTDAFLREATPDTTNPSSNQNFDKAGKRTYSTRAIVEILLRRTEKKLHKDVFDGKDIEVPDANGSVWSIREWGKDAFGTDKKQRRAFEAIAAAFVLTFLQDTSEAEEETEPGDLSKLRRTKLALLRLKGHRDNPQLICLLHGPGGSGKSTVINMVMAYAKSFCEVLGHPFTSRTIIITAMSGVAATLLHGETTHSVIGLNRTKIEEEEIEAFADARLLIIDEISFASKRDFQKMYTRCQKLMRQNYKVYGGLNVVFAGDYSQLEPVRQSPIYEEGMLPEFHAAINCFIELDGKWRFMKDPPWGQVMFRFRTGNPTIEDIDLINESCHVDVKTPTPGIQIATHTNKNRDAVNAAVFEEYCKKNKPADGSVLTSAVMIFMDNLCMRNSGKALVPIESNCVKKFFYENCSESQCDVGERGRVDPVLRVFADCPMMLTQNKNVPEGQANGSRVTLHQIVLRTGEQPFPLELACGTTVNGLFASQVKTIILKHVAPDIIPQLFQVQAEDFTFTSTLQIGTEEVIAAMKGTQFPVISNACTTGHKLQGCTCHELLVNEWHYGSNWAYVVLSRVKTMAGLFIRQKLSYDLKKYRKPERMTKMLEYFREKCSITNITDEEYEELVISSDINH